MFKFIWRYIPADFNLIWNIAGGGLIYFKLSKQTKNISEIPPNATTWKVKYHSLGTGGSVNKMSVMIRQSQGEETKILQMSDSRKK